MIRRLPVLLAALAVMMTAPVASAAAQPTTPAVDARACAALTIDAADALRAQLLARADLSAVLAVLPAGVPVPTPAAIATARARAGCAPDETATTRGTHSAAEVTAALCLALDVDGLRDVLDGLIDPGPITSLLTSATGTSVLTSTVAAVRVNLNCTSTPPTTPSTSTVTTTPRTATPAPKPPTGFSQVGEVPVGSIDTGRA